MSTSTDAEDRLLDTPIRDLGLAIPGSRLGPLIDRFYRELVGAGVVRLRPHFYLSTEWGVPFGSISVSVPFYLADDDLIALHARRVSFLEGAGRGDLLRYLRHETGHVVNYAYRLYDRADWTAIFGPIGLDYEEDYRPEPFSSRYVCHLPGWYAQMHPDEDWSETFAVWMTPGYDWKAAYAGWPVALAKLTFCDDLMREINGRDPEVVAEDPDEEVGGIAYTLRQYYEGRGDGGPIGTGEAVDPVDSGPVFAPAYDASLRGIFEDFGDIEDPSTAAPRRGAADLIRRLERNLATDVYRWTGCFPERVRPLIGQLADRAEAMHQMYPEDREVDVVVALTSLVAALAMDHIFLRRPYARRGGVDGGGPTHGSSAPVTE
jgi:hypothetical protein